MSVFKRRRFPAEIILLCVRWYCRYGISYRDLEEMMDERGVAVDHVTLYRWVQRYAPELEKRVRWYQGYRSSSWRVDETYVRVGGKWKYLFRAVDKQGRLIDFMLSDRRNTKAARRFLAKALKVMRNWPPVSITTDKLGSYPKALRRLKREGELKDTVRHRTSKYLNNRIEADHGALKRLIRPTRGFQSMKTAYATIKGFEIMRMIRRRHAICGVMQNDAAASDSITSRWATAAPATRRQTDSAYRAVLFVPVRECSIHHQIETLMIFSTGPHWQS
jgi:transposase, IS6 family